MEMDDDLGKFLEDQKAKVAEDRACLEQDPPYMEIRRSDGRSLKPMQKENVIPDEGMCLSLPLGEDYERKKHKLQQELRMDYRRYITQRRHIEPTDTGTCQAQSEGEMIKTVSNSAGGACPVRVRDAATLTDECWFAAVRDGGRRQTTQIWDSDEELYLPRETRFSKVNHTSLRETPGRDKHSDGHRESELRRHRTRHQDRVAVSKTTHTKERSRPGAKQDEAEFATGLLIGSGDADVALQRRKERYRRELQEQISEQQRNRKREKDLELRVAVTDVTDPEKEMHCIKQVGSVSGGVGRRLKQFGSVRGGVGRHVEVLREEERLFLDSEEQPPPNHPRPAFHSPVLDYSSALGHNTDSVSSLRVPVMAPHPPSAEAEPYTPPYDDAYFYYGTRNPLDPNTASYGSVVGMPHMNYVQMHSTAPQPSVLHSGYNRANYTHTESLRAADAGSAFPVLSYKEALRQQIAERAERRHAEEEERRRYEAQLEADMRAHEPWGKAGGGAPLRDSTGNLIADLNQMHRLNVEAYMSGAQRQERPASSHRVSGFTKAQTPQFPRGSVFHSHLPAQQLLEQDQYKAFLRQQIEEKRQKQAEERERLRVEEEKEEKRLAEQREKIQREYEEEMERKKLREMEQKAKNEELMRLAEERRKEAERKKREEEEKESTALRKQQEREKQSGPQQAPRTPSPPVPTLQRKQRQQSGAMDRSQSPPVPACRNQLRAEAEKSGVINELCVLRRQLRSEQRRLEGQLLQAEMDELISPLNNRRRVDVFDMARLRMPVRGPSPRFLDPVSSQIFNSTQHAYRDVHSCQDSRGYDDIEYRAAQRQRQRSASNQRRRENPDDFSELSLPLPQTPQTPRWDDLKDGMRGSLLLSESAFIDQNGAAFPVPPDSEDKTAPLSARERRRLTKRRESQNNRATCRGTEARQSEQNFTKETLRHKNTHRMKRLQALAHQTLFTGKPSVDDDDKTDLITPRQGERCSSVETVNTQP